MPSASRICSRGSYFAAGALRWLQSTYLQYTGRTIRLLQVTHRCRFRHIQGDREGGIEFFHSPVPKVPNVIREHRFRKTEQFVAVDARIFLRPFPHPRRDLDTQTVAPRIDRSACDRGKPGINQRLAADDNEDALLLRAAGPGFLCQVEFRQAARKLAGRSPSLTSGWPAIRLELANPLASRVWA
jgi:hypothetical protein